MKIPIMMSDLSDNVQDEIRAALLDKNPKYLEILENNDDIISFIDLDDLSERDPISYQLVSMNETEEEEAERPGFVLCRSLYLLENYNCPDVAICLDVGDQRMLDILNYIIYYIKNKKQLKNFYQFGNEKIKLVDSENGELIFIVIADSEGLFPEHRMCDPKYARQLEYIELINLYYQEDDDASFDT